jgi:RimJ/RimL family protein N-acetyltransferase
VSQIPDETVRTFARTIFHESKNYGFGNVDVLRLINELMDLAADTGPGAHTARPAAPVIDRHRFQVDAFPLRSERLRIRKADIDVDRRLIESWIADQYGQYFLLSCATAQHVEVQSILRNPHNDVGIISLADGPPIGAVAFLDVDVNQRRAELRKLIGVAAERGKGYAEEATALWLAYGHRRLGIEKFYVSTLQTHLRNIQLNEAIGFRIEGILRGEIRVGDKRHDVLRMGMVYETPVPD